MYFWIFLSQQGKSQILDNVTNFEVPENNGIDFILVCISPAASGYNLAAFGSIVVCCFFCGYCW